MPSTQYLNSLQVSNMLVMYDFKIWGGVSPPTSSTLPDSKVVKVTLNAGASFDSAQFTLPGASFGQSIPYYMPVKIVYVEPVSGTSIVVFKGFVNSTNQTIDNSKDVVTVSCLDYKWYYSKITKIRGRWYKTENALAATPAPITASFTSTTGPFSLGSGLSVGDEKFNFEKFRGLINENTGYLQNEQCIFNNNSIPDCFVDNVIGTVNNVFYLDNIGYDEESGLLEDFFVAKPVNGFHWTYATILKHIEQFWIQPYNSTFAGLRIHNGDLSLIADIDDNLNKPLGYSIENLSPIEAIDKVVRSLPGKWMWYLDYKSAVNRVRIRIKEIQNTLFTTSTVALISGDNCEKISDSNANIINASVNRNIGRTIKNVIARGGKIKLITTIKLVPLWERFVAAGGTLGERVDFEDDQDIADYLSYLNTVAAGSNSNNPLKFDDKLTESQILRYSKMFQHYGVPIDGATFANNIVDINTGITGTLTPFSSSFDLRLTGDIANNYSALTTDLKEMMFENARIDREIDSPQFDRYTDDPVIFIHDVLHDGQIRARTPGENLERVRRSLNNLKLLSDQSQKAADIRWIIPEDLDVAYRIDKKNGTVVFNTPQIQRSISKSRNQDQQFLDIAEKIQSVLNSDGAFDSFLTRARELTTREVYMTATFTLDIAAIISKKVDSIGLLPAIIDSVDGPPFTEYINQADTDIIIHNAAFYPLSSQNKNQTEPVFLRETMDGKIMGKKIVPAQLFPEYKFYASTGAFELMTAIRSFLQGHSDLDEKVTATLPYLELGYNLGDKLFEIQNTNYTDLRSNLVGIVYQSVSTSDIYNTSYTFNNNYGSNKSEVAVINKNQKLNADKNKRQPIVYVNQLQNRLV